jgi:hypothetical protein
MSIGQFNKQTFEDVNTIDFHGNGGTNKAKGGKATTSNDPSDPNFGHVPQERETDRYVNLNQLNFEDYNRKPHSKGIKLLIDIPAVGDPIEETDMGIYIDNSPNQAIWSLTPIFNDNSKPLTGTNTGSLKPTTDTNKSMIAGFLSPLGSDKDPQGQYNGMYTLHPKNIGQKIGGVDKYFKTTFQNGGVSVIYANKGSIFKFFLNPKNPDNATLTTGDYVDFLRTNFPFVDKIDDKTKSWTGCIMQITEINDKLEDAGGQQYSSDFKIVTVEVVEKQAPIQANRLTTLFS